MNVIMRTSVYSRTESGKSWKSKPDSVTEKRIDKEQVDRIADSIYFFRNLGGYERLERAYFEYGYLPWKLTSISPDRSIKKVREFDYK